MAQKKERDALLAELIDWSQRALELETRDMERLVVDYMAHVHEDSGNMMREPLMDRLALHEGKQITVVMPTRLPGVFLIAAALWMEGFDPRKALEAAMERVDNLPSDLRAAVLTVQSETGGEN